MIVIGVLSVFYRMELELTTELTKSRDYYSDHLDLAYEIGNSTEEELIESNRANFERYESLTFA